MVIYKCIGKNREKAISNAKKKYGNDIQIIYEREFLYGFLNHIWVEVGFFLNKTENIYVPKKYESAEHLNIAFACDRLVNILIENDFSVEIIEKISGQFYSEFPQTNCYPVPSALENFLKNKISKLVDELESDIVVPNSFILCSITSGMPFILNFINNFPNDKFTVVNFSKEYFKIDKVKLYNVENAEQLRNIYDNVKNERLIFNIPYDDMQVADKISEIFSIACDKSTVFYLPSYIKSSKAVELMANKKPLGVVWGSFSDKDTIGNIISVSLLTKCRPIYFSYDDKIATCTKKKILDSIKFSI